MFTADLLERAFKTFLQAFVVTFGGLMAVPDNVTDVGAWKAAGLAALAGALSAGLSAVMSALSKPVGDPNSASLVAPAPAPVTITTHIVDPRRESGQGVVGIIVLVVVVVLAIIGLLALLGR